jgi:hypothetical protein
VQKTNRSNDNVQKQIRSNPLVTDKSYLDVAGYSDNLLQKGEENDER